MSSILGRGTLYSVLTVMCAALYALGAYSTSYIESPWGIGQFRPAVIIPAFFAISFGPLVGGVGAAMGTFIQSIVRYGHPWLTLISGTPANFVAFYLFGALLHKKFSWTRFLIVSVMVLIFANLLCAVGVLGAVVTGIYPIPLSPPYYTGFVIGLTLWWFITMLPFVLLFTPVLLRSVAMALPHLIPEAIRRASLKKELPTKSFGLTLAFSGIAVLSIGASALFSPVANVFAAAIGPRILSGVVTMFLATGSASAFLGSALMVVNRLLKA